MVSIWGRLKTRHRGHIFRYGSGGFLKQGLFESEQTTKKCFGGGTEIGSDFTAADCPGNGVADSGSDPVAQNCLGVLCMVSLQPCGAEKVLPPWPA